MRVTIVVCYECGKEKGIPTKEYNRQLKAGRTFFFCGRSCFICHNNKKRGLPIATKICKHCGASFKARIGGVYEAEFCSSSCASKGSVTPLRRQKAALFGTQNAKKNFVNGHQKALKRREAWKYERIKRFLERIKIPYEFEFMLPGTVKVFDLALPTLKTLIEFDGPNHKYLHVEDAYKTKIAYTQGWDVIRIPVKPSTVIPLHKVKWLIK
jgi:very-short-patch-repair endonuclease